MPSPSVLRIDYGCFDAGGIPAAVIEQFDWMFLLLSEVPVEEAGDLAEDLLGFGRRVVAEIVGVGLAFEHLQGGFDTGLSQFAVNTDRIAQQQVARTAGQDRWREPFHVAVNRRQHRVLEVEAIGINLGAGIAEPIRRY